MVIAIGMIATLPSGPIMSLPAQVLQPQTRAIGMGIFYTVFYATMMLGPAVGGVLAKSTGSVAVAFDFGAVMLLACVPLLAAFNRIAATPRVRPVAASTDSGPR